MALISLISFEASYSCRVVTFNLNENLRFWNANGFFFFFFWDKDANGCLNFKVIHFLSACMWLKHFNSPSAGVVLCKYATMKVQIIIGKYFIEEMLGLGPKGKLQMVVDYGTIRFGV